jgi:hypothetical protein
LTPFHDNFTHLFSFFGGAALGFVMLPPEMQAWDKVGRLCKCASCSTFVLLCFCILRLQKKNATCYESRRYHEARVHHFQSIAACAAVIVVGLPFVWFLAIGDSGCGAGCQAMSCAGVGSFGMLHHIILCV